MPFHFSRADDPVTRTVAVTLVAGSTTSTESVPAGAAYSLFVIGANVNPVNLPTELLCTPGMLIKAVVFVSGLTTKTLLDSRFGAAYSFRVNGQYAKPPHFCEPVGNPRMA